jgi:hypothetical protein
MECGDQVLRNFNGLVIHLRGTKENPKSKDVLAKHKAQIPLRRRQERPEFKVKPRDEEKSRGDQSPSNQMQLKTIQKTFPKGNNKVQVVEK